MNDGLSEANALAIAFGKFAEDFVLYVGNGAAIEDTSDAIGEIGAAESLELARELEIFGGTHFKIERGRLGKVADAALHFEGILENVVARHGGRACCGPEEAGEHTHRGGLPGSIGAEKTDDLSLLHFEGDVVNGGVASVPLSKLFYGDHKKLFLKRCGLSCQSSRAKTLKRKHMLGRETPCVNAGVA